MDISEVKQKIKDGVLKLFYVYVPANVYAGKWYDFRSLKIPVVAETADAAIKVVNDHRQNVLGWAKTLRTGQSRRRLLPGSEPANRNVFFKDTYFVQPERIFGRLGFALCPDGRFYHVDTPPNRA